MVVVLYENKQTMVDLIQDDNYLDSSETSLVLRLLGQADHLAQTGKIMLAFNTYSKALKLFNYPAQKLLYLADALIKSHNNREIYTHMSSEKIQLFRCYVCKEVFIEPVTLSCGHTFCTKCLTMDILSCRVCGATDYARGQTTLILCNLVEKIFPRHVCADRLHFKAKQLVEDGNYTHAIDVFTAAMREAPSSHLVLINRSMAYTSIGKYTLALNDAEAVIKLQPAWTEGYYQKGVVLYEMQRYTESVSSYLDCLTIDPSNSTAKEQLMMSLYKLLKEDADQEHELCTPCISSSKMETEKDQASLQFETNEYQFETSKEKMQSIMKRNSNINQCTSKECSHSIRMQVDKEDSCKKFSRFNENKSHSLPVCLFPPKIFQLKSASEPSLQGIEFSKKYEGNSSNPQIPPSQLDQCQPLILCEKACCTPCIHLLKLEDLQCSLCFVLLFQPVVTPCGHTFCKECLVRSLDHNPKCPLCKTSLEQYIAEQNWAVVDSLHNIICTYFPEDYAKVEREHEDLMKKFACKEKKCEIQVFVCTFACPTIRCPLHIFEPRYRLMIRRCLESGSNQFGMTVPEANGNYPEFGCMLDIKTVQMLANGCSLLDTVGGRRFHVHSWESLDGYDTAFVSFVEDDPIQPEERGELLNLEREVYEKSKKWLTLLQPERLREITDYYGCLPKLSSTELDTPNGPAWVWWMITILPIDSKLQITAMSFKKLQQRLLFIKSVIDTIQSKLSS